MVRPAKTTDEEREASAPVDGDVLEPVGTATAQPPRFSLLLVDRDDEYGRRLGRELERMRGELSVMPPGDELLETLAALRPTALLVSLDEPDTNPFELLKKLRISSEWASLPVFLVGTRLDDELELRAYAEGAHAVLKRAESLAELTARLRGLNRELETPPATEPPLRSSGSAEPAQAGGGVPDVVVVEDDPSLQEMLEYSLRNRGYEIAQYSDGLEALRILQELETGNKRPVILLDVDLPGLDGFRILQDLADSRPGDFQVILCTMHRSEAAQVLALQSGAVDYLVKPLRVPILIAKLERLLGTAQE